MSTNKITLKEFFDNKNKLGIFCDTEEKANKLCEEFDKFGKTWNTGDSYLEDTWWTLYKTDTVYYNKGTFGNINRVDDNTKIYLFEDIIFDKSLKKEKNYVEDYKEFCELNGIEYDDEKSFNKYIEFIKSNLILLN